MKVLVIGAGVVGLTTAVCIQETFPRVNITIEAEKFPLEDIVSMVAGAFVLVSPKPDDPPYLKRMVIDTCQYLLKLDGDGNSLVHGVQKREGCYATGTLTYGEKLSDDLRPLSVYAFGKAELLSPEECRKLVPNSPCSGWRVLTCCVDSRRYLPYLLNKFHSKGGHVKRGKIEKFSQVDGDYDVIVNCTAMGSKALADDKTMFPVKGQLLRMETEGKVNDFAFAVNTLKVTPKKTINYYHIPHGYDTVFGGTYEVGVEDRSTDEDIMEEIEKYARETHPELKNAKVLQRYTGLRPCRKGGLRIEKEDQEIKGKKVTVIHNYGHGAYGVGLSWGSAIKVTELLGQSMYCSKL